VIGSLRGTVLDRCLRSDHQVELLVEVSGVGYRAMVPAGSAGHAVELGGPVFLHVHTHVREDALVLYGFSSREERECFELLLSAHGVGPAVALALLSVLTPAALGRAVLTEDLSSLMLVPGIGKKTAQRLVMGLARRPRPGARARDAARGQRGRPGRSARRAEGRSGRPRLRQRRGAPGPFPPARRGYD
jgi:Holliday junction DNA helicase RuvA